MSEEIAIAELRTWIGKQERQSDTITPALLQRFKATFSGCSELISGPNSPGGSPLPLGLHWCLAQPAIPSAGLGTDGHPAKGGFLPPVPLPRRMWASSKVRFHKSLAEGAAIERTSTIADVVLKQSTASGPLVFVQIDHKYVQDNALLIEDSQTIVYRHATTFRPAEATQVQRKSARNLNIVPNSTLLFRYSAMTFNGHRIHYDHNYVTHEEGYPGLLVHGPLMATLLMNLAQTTEPNSPLREFEFRGIAPAFVDQSLRLSVTEGETAMGRDTKSLEISNHHGALIMTATAGFALGNDVA